METKPENEISETAEVAPKESTESLSRQGIASIQGEEIPTAVEKTENPEPDEASSSTDLNPPTDFQPKQAAIDEYGMDERVETGPEKTEKEIFSSKDKETGKPGGLDWHPSNPEGGG